MQVLKSLVPYPGSRCLYPGPREEEMKNSVRIRILTLLVENMKALRPKL
jgi:hypothetical protein